MLFRQPLMLRNQHKRDSRSICMRTQWGNQNGNVKSVEYSIDEINA